MMFAFMTGIHHINPNNPVMTKNTTAILRLVP